MWSEVVVLLNQVSKTFLHNIHAYVVYVGKPWASWSQRVFVAGPTVNDGISSLSAVSTGDEDNIMSCA